VYVYVDVYVYVYVFVCLYDVLMYMYVLSFSPTRTRALSLCICLFLSLCLSLFFSLSVDMQALQHSMQAVNTSILRNIEIHDGVGKTHKMERLTRTQMGQNVLANTVASGIQGLKLRMLYV